MMRIIIFIILLVLALVVYFLLVVRIGQKPKGRRLEVIKNATNYRGGKFRNEVATKTLTSNKKGVKRLASLYYGKE